MKRMMAALAALALCAWQIAPGLAAQGDPVPEPLALAEDSAGDMRLPPGAATYIVTYAFPRVVAQSAADESVDAALRARCEALLAYHREQAEFFAPDAFVEGVRTVELSYEVTANDGRYFSVKLIEHGFQGDSESESLSALTFARSGVYAGQALTLSQLTGLEEDAVTTESYAARLSYEAVWQIIETQRASAQRDYDMDLTLDTLKAAFDPEHDFFVDADGNIVFFVQPGMIAGVVEGALTYAFAPAELLSTARE